MKSCPYCGKEYSDDATICVLDHETLRNNPSQLPDSRVKSGDALSVKKTLCLTYPDYKWSSADAWKYLGLIVVFEFVIGTIISALKINFPDFRRWCFGGFSYFFIDVSYFAIYVFTAAYFARTVTLASFSMGMGLNRKISKYALLGLAAAIALNFFGALMITHKWGTGVHNHDVMAFKHTSGVEKYFFLIPTLLLAPIFEELTNRGFLYKAFRGSYPLGFSMTLIMMWTAATHWSQYSHSLLAAFILSLLTLVQCYIREKSGSLWDCIVCHFAFNASPWLVAAIWQTNP